MTNNDEIVERIRQARRERGFTQQQLADFIHKTGSNISEIERGRIQVNAADLYDIARALNKPIEYFYGENFGDSEIEDLAALLRREPESTRHETIQRIKSMILMQHIADRIELSSSEPSETDVIEFLKEFLSYSKELDRQNNEVKRIKGLLLEELKNQGLDLLNLDQN